MATAETGNGVSRDAESEPARTSPFRERSFVTEIFDGADDALAAYEAVETGLITTGFQTLAWLTVLYEELAPPRRAMPRLVVVSDDVNGDVVLALPLVVVREGQLRVAVFPDFGVGAYGAPMLGPQPLTEKSAIRRAWRSVRSSMRDVDLIRFERMPAAIGDRPNPLLMLFGSAPSRVSGNSLTVRGGFDDYLQNVGKKYRKDFERCHRLWQKEGAPRFYRASTDDEIAHVFATLEEQEAVWHAEHGSSDNLADPACRAFYERLAIDGSDAGLTALFALEANGKIVATLFCLEHDRTVTILKISTGGARWSHLSPGRLVVLEAVKHYVARGVTRFEMGVGSDPLKHTFGTEDVPLHDLVSAQDVTALPKAVLHELLAHLGSGRGRRIRAAFEKVMPKLVGRGSGS